MSRNLKPRPDNNLTERYRSQLNLVGSETFRNMEENIGKNLIITDNVIPKSVCEDLLENVYSQSNSKWSPNIGYGNDDDWPVDEWGYTLVKPTTDKWVESGQTNRIKKIWKIFQNYMKEDFDIKSLQLNGSHINATTFGQESQIHRDSYDGTEAFVIIFINNDMNAYDGGELQTYISLEPDINKNKDNHKSEILHSISPIQGRIAIADSRVLHRGLAPTRFYSKARITVVFKFKFTDYNQDMKKLDWK